MGLKQLVVAAAMAMGLGLATAPEAKSETLAEALAYAYEHSGLLEQNRALLRIADEDVAQAVAGLRPIINWAGNITAAWPVAPASPINPAGGDLVSASLTLTIDQLLYDGGASRYEIEAARESVLATRQDLLQVEQQVLLRAITAYLDVRRQTEFVALRRSNVRVITEELRAARDRFEVGEVTRTDVSLAEARLAAARSELAAAEAALSRARAEFRVAIGRDPGSLRVPRPAPVPATLEEAKAYAVRNHPAIRSVQHSVQAAELTILAAEAAQGPSLTLRGTISVDENLDDRETLGLNFGGPIYQGGALPSQIRALMARRDSTRAQLHIIRHDIEQGVANAFAGLAAARSRTEAFERQVRAATVAFNGVREEATLGARTTLDVLNAEQELLDARTNLISAQVDEIEASFQVLFAMGLLTAEHLNLAVQLYDPEAYYNLVKDAPAAVSEQGRALDRVLEAIGD